MNISPELLKKFESDYRADPSNAIIAGAVAKSGIEDASFNYDVRRRHNFYFSDETERGEITNQKKSGRCWMFASLNAARVETMKKLNLETFELSQNYTLFWDKTETPFGDILFGHQIIDNNDGSVTIKHTVTLDSEDQQHLEFLSQVFSDVPHSIFILKNCLER